MASSKTARGAATLHTRSAEAASNAAHRLSVYDGRHHLGDVQGSKSAGFTVLAADGAHVGTFETLRAAGDALSHRTVEGA